MKSHKANKLTNKKVSILKRLPSTIHQLLGDIDFDTFRVYAHEYGAAYFFKRRPWRAFETARNMNARCIAERIPFKVFRLGRRVIMIDTNKVNYKIPNYRTNEFTSAYKNSEPPSGFRGSLPGHGDSRREQLNSDVIDSQRSQLLRDSISEDQNFPYDEIEEEDIDYDEDRYDQ
jgi:hypothetical protein